MEMNRKKIIYIAIISILIIIPTAVLSAERAIDKIKFPPLNKQEAPKAEKVTLANGISLYLLEDHELPIINVAVRLAAGEYLAPSDKIGLAAIAGKVMRTGGTDKMTGDQIDSSLEAMGASIEVNIGTTSGTARLNVLSEFADIGLGILADILRRPVYEQDKIDLEKTAQRSQISRRNDEAMDICVREFKKIIYGFDSPYARHTEYATIDNIGREDLLDFHRKYINPDNIMMAVWGDFEKGKMIAQIKSLFEDWPAGAGKVPKLPEVSYEFKPGVHYAPKDNVNQTKLMIGHIGGFLGDPDYYAMVVMNNILGGSFGSRLFNEVRSRQGLAYAVGGSYTSNIAYPGIYYNYCFTKSESTVKAIRSIINEIKRMQTVPPSEDEMRIGKDGYLNSFVFKFEDKGEILTRMMEYDYFGFPQDFLYQVKDNIEKVTSQDVLAVAQKRLKPEALQIMVVGKGADFDEPLTVFGPVDTIDVTIPTGEPKTASSVSDPAATAKGLELLKKAAQAVGGDQKLAEIKAIQTKGSLTVVTPGGEFAMEATGTFVFPDKIKEAIVTPMGEMISVIEADKGWAKQGASIVPATPEQIAEARKDFFRNTILALKSAEAPTYKVGFLSNEELAGKPVNVIQITSMDDAFSYKMALDTETGLPAGKYYFGQTMMGPANMVEIYSDYREVAGIKMPFHILYESDGKKTMEMTVREITINPELPADFFEQPK
jgi:predicted Zn-dependent peptidase